MNIMDISVRDTSTLLDVTALCENESYLKKALVISAVHKISVNEKPYVAFRFRDCNGRVVTGNMYNVENVQECMHIAKEMVNKVCSVQFDVNRFRGDLTMDIIKIDPLVDTTVQPKDFVGVVEGLDSMLEQISKRIEQASDKEFAALHAAINGSNMLPRIKYAYNDKYGLRCGSTVEFLFSSDNIMRSLVNTYEANLALLLNVIIVSLDTLFQITNDTYERSSGQMKAIIACGKIVDTLRTEVSKFMSETSAKNLVDEVANILISNFSEGIKYYTNVGILLSRSNDLAADSIKLKTKLSNMLVDSTVPFGETMLHKMR